MAPSAVSKACNLRSAYVVQSGSGLGVTVSLGNASQMKNWKPGCGIKKPRFLSDQSAPPPKPPHPYLQSGEHTQKTFWEVRLQSCRNLQAAGSAASGLCQGAAHLGRRAVPAIITCGVKGHCPDLGCTRSLDYVCRVSTGSSCHCFLPMASGS